MAKCEGKIYSTSQFCYEDKIYSRCGTADYNPSTSFCLASAVKPKCNGSEYTAAQFCFGSELYSKCGNASSGAEYDPTSESCCGSNKYSLDAQFCYGTTAYNKCGGADYKVATESCCNNEKYSLATQFCHNNSSIVNFCSSTNQQTYNPNLYECKPGINPNGIYLKGGVELAGKTYNAVLIGTQTWMAENLGSSVSWATAMDFLSSCNSNSCSNLVLPKHQGICPNGWHIPSNAEWTTLTTFVGTDPGKKLKATSSNWNNTFSGSGTDDYGFSAMPIGSGNTGATPCGIGKYGVWWSTLEASDSKAYGSCMSTSHASVGVESYDKATLYSVRCVKD